MRTRYASVSLSLIAILLLCFHIPIQVWGETQFGPRSDLNIFYYADDTSLWGALVSGEVDFSFWEATPSQYEAAIADPKILLAPVPRFDVSAFSLNLNETIADYAGVKNPLSHVDFRRAINRLSNKDYYVNTVNKGFATKLAVAISAPSSSWWNMSVVNFVEGRTPGRYPWPYDALTFDRAAAAALLDAAGFTDVELDGVRNYPADWPGRPGRPNLDALKFSIRNDDLLRRAAGLDLAAEMRAVGIPVDEFVENFPSSYTRVMILRNYHIYTSGWSVGRFPTYLYNWFHSSRWFAGGSNFHICHHTDPTYDELDVALEKINYPPSYNEAMLAAQDAQYILTEKFAIMVPLWSAKAFYPYSSDLLGVTNYQSVGPENDYTYLKAWRLSASSLRVGLKAPPLEVNQIYSRWLWDISTMSPFMAGFLSNPAYNIMRDQPWLVQDWSSTPDTWYDGPVEKSKVTYWFRDDPVDGLGDKDAEWIDPVTGNVLADFAPQWVEGGGYEFNCWYYASEPAGWIFSSYADIHHIRVFPEQKRAEVYMNVKSYWSMYWPYGRLIYRPAWLQSPLVVDGNPTLVGTQPVTKSFTKADIDPSKGEVKTSVIPYRVVGSIVEVINVTVNGALLVKASGQLNNDYEIVKGKLTFYTLSAIPADAIITATYWARGDPAGYAPGSLFRSDRTGVGRVWVGTGPFYMTDHISGAGGWATYKKNPHFFLETPPKGEIDFWWNWFEGQQPRKGYYIVDVLDAVKSTWALDSQGYAVPSLNWESGADLTWPGGATPKGKVTVHDITIVTGADWGRTFGNTP